MLARIVGVTLALLMLPAHAGQREFCAGFEEGYETGYMQEANTSIPPYAPYCPTQTFETHADPDSDFEHGYTVGYRTGIADGSRRMYRSD
jgi:hypothetical protein